MDATREVAKSLDVRVAISEAVRRRLQQCRDAHPNIRLIRNGVDLQRFNFHRMGRPDGVHRILFAGRLDAVKRPLLLPEIAEGLHRRRGKADFLFVIAGDGPERTALVSRIRKSGLDSKFDLRGHVDDIAPLLAECELLVLPSEMEGIPLVILEAFAASRTVVASAVGGVMEIVTRETGIAIPKGPREVSEFVEALNRLIDHPAERDVCARNGRMLVELQFDRRRFVKDYQELFA